MKTARKLALALFASSVMVCNSASFIDTFDGLTPRTPGDPLNTYNSWTQNQPNPGPDAPLAWGQLIGGSNGAGIGAAYAEPLGVTFSASHTIDSLDFSRLNLRISFAITDSDSNFPQRNDYFVSVLGSGSNNLFTLFFKAATQPGPGGASDMWNITWNSDLNPTGGSLGAALENRFYTFDLSVITEATQNVFSLSLEDDTGIVATTNGIFNTTSETVNTYSVGTTIGSGAAWGDGFISIDNVAVVPEPTSIGLLSLAVLGLVLRRNRN